MDSSLIVIEAIELNAPGRPRVQAYRYRELAVHQTLSDQSKWTITHLPSGLHFGFYWHFHPRAIEAMLAIYPILDNWALATKVQIEKASPALWQVLKKHRGRRFNFIPSVAEKTRFNGFSGIN